MHYSEEEIEEHVSSNQNAIDVALYQVKTTENRIKTQRERIIKSWFENQKIEWSQESSEIQETERKKFIAQAHFKVYDPNALHIPPVVASDTEASEIWEEEKQKYDSEIAKIKLHFDNKMKQESFLKTRNKALQWSYDAWDAWRKDNVDSEYKTHNELTSTINDLSSMINEQSEQILSKEGEKDVLIKKINTLNSIIATKDNQLQEMGLKIQELETSIYKNDIRSTCEKKRKNGALNNNEPVSFLCPACAATFNVPLTPPC